MYAAIERTLKREYADYPGMGDTRIVIEGSTLNGTFQTAYSLVMKRHRFNDDFLRVSKEAEERLSVDRPSTMFFYGL